MLCRKEGGREVEVGLKHWRTQGRGGQERLSVGESGSRSKTQLNQSDSVGCSKR